MGIKGSKAYQQHSFNTNIAKMIKFIILSLELGAFIQSTNGLTQEEAVLVEKFAFEKCDYNKDSKLCWAEVDYCEKTWGHLLEANNITLPTEEDFNSEAGEDGLLTWEEWLAWTGISIIEDDIDINIM